MLAKELGRGGEGVVYEVPGKPDTVAKIYLKPPGAQLSAKLSAMAGMASRRLLRIAAWPTATLHDSSGAIAGFMMPRVGGHKPIFQLYLPKPRLRLFPEADWRFLIHAAANTARAFATVHSAGLVIGDVNHGNLVVDEDATVRMIDCDSFQLSQGGQTWFCTVGVGTHQPPEMQGRDSYAGVIRTPNHDNFGLAVLIFQLLCMARHPFAGRFLGMGEPPSIEEAITGSRYAYSRESWRTKMGAPPGSLPIGALSSELQDLFEQAFAPGVTRGGRPVADRWISALGSLADDLRCCRTTPAHYYRNGLATCPWCGIEHASGITLFPVVFLPGAINGRGIAVLWQEVDRVPEPLALGPWRELPLGGFSPSPKARRAGEKGRKLRVAAWASVVVAMTASLGSTLLPPMVRIHAFLWSPILIPCFMYWVHRSIQNNPGPFQKRLIDAGRNWEKLRSSWLISIEGQSFAQIRDTLLRHKAGYEALPIERAERLQRLQEQHRTKQFEDHLDRFMIASAKIPGLDSTKVAALSAHGIDTAGDIASARLRLVANLGPNTLASLLEWRQHHERSFRFDPNRGGLPANMARIERSIVAHRTRLEREVEAGIARLKSVSSTEAARARALKESMGELGPRYAQAFADAAAVPRGRQTHLRLLAISVLVTVVALISGPSTELTEGWVADPPKDIPASAVQLAPTMPDLSAELGTSVNAQLDALYVDYPWSYTISDTEKCIRRGEKPRLLSHDRWTTTDGVQHQIFVAAARAKDDDAPCSAILGIKQTRWSAWSNSWEPEILAPAVTRLGTYYYHSEELAVLRVKVSFVDGGSFGRVVVVENDIGDYGKLFTRVSVMMAVDKKFKEVLQVPISLNIDQTCDGDTECLLRAVSANYNSKLDIKVGRDYGLHIDQVFRAAYSIAPASWIIDKKGVVWQTASARFGTEVSARRRDIR